MFGIILDVVTIVLNATIIVLLLKQRHTDA